MRRRFVFLCASSEKRIERLLLSGYDLNGLPPFRHTARTGAMFFWAILWISCASIVREGKSTSTHAMGIVRGWIQGGAILSIPFSLFLSELSTEVIACICLLLLVGVFAACLPAMTEEESHVKNTQNLAEEQQHAIAVSDFTRRCDRITAERGLSPREREVLACLAKGRNLPYIRETLYISRNTINTHIKHIYAKLDIHSCQELIDLFEDPGDIEAKR